LTIENLELSVLSQFYRPTGVRTTLASHDDDDDDVGGDDDTLQADSS